MAIVARGNVKDLETRRALNHLASATDGDFSFTSYNNIGNLEVRRVMTSIRNVIVSGKGSMPSVDRVEDLEVRRVLNSIIDKVRK